MDRERLFRGKRVDNGEWVEGASINKQTDIHGKKHVYVGLPAVYKMYHHQETVEWVEVIPETVGEYTGSPDKSGNKIFEDDIVRDTFNGEILFIKYLSEYMRFVPVRKGIIFRIISNSRMEVIGNIHDNPELLNADKSAAEYADNGVLQPAT
ncbi:MAG: hypothetical protein J1F01_05620 [Oscillospiraceae bacterium]|nr:hypothetical protein [Oscillospiraceae bacterium]